MKIWRPRTIGWLHQTFNRAIDVLYRALGWHLVVYIDKRLPAKTVRVWDITHTRWVVIKMRCLNVGDIFCLEGEHGNPWVCLSKPKLSWDLVWNVQAEPALITSGVPMLYGDILKAMEEGVLIEEMVDFIYRGKELKPTSPGESYGGNYYNAGYYNKDLCQ